MLAHELREPLTAIRSSAHLLKKYGDQLPELERQRHCGFIEQCSAQMADLVDNMLTLSRAHAGQLACRPQRLHLGLFCRELSQHMQRIYPDREVVLRSEPGTEAYFELDDHLMRLIFGNLLTNALKYSPPDAPVELCLALGQGAGVVVDGVAEGLPDSAWLRVDVRDHGVGIPPEDQEHLFQLFRRGRNTGTVAGVGLGLAIMRQAVLSHGGVVQFVTAENQGTTFTVLLPAVPAAAAPAVPG